MTAHTTVIADQGSLRREARPHRIFLLIAPILYALYALLTPPFQTPDEHQHLFRAWQLSEFQLVGERRGTAAGGILPGTLGQAALLEIGTLKPHSDDRPVVKRSFLQSFARGTSVKSSAPDRFYDFRGGVLYSPAGYVPPVVSVWVGEATGLSIENIIRLGRLLNGAMAIFLIYCAIRLVPIGASAMLFVGLLPMTAAACASFGQDGLVIGASSVLVASGLRNLFSRQTQFSNLMVSAAVAIPLALCKIFYLPLGLIGAQPMVARKVQMQRLWPWLAMCSFGFLLAAAWLHADAGAMVAPWRGIPPAGLRLADAMHHPFEFPALLEHTYVGHGAILLDSLFEFGWLNVPSGSAAPALCAVACGVVLIGSEPGARQLTWQTRSWLIASVIASVLLISIAGWIYGTPTGTEFIFGLQGRYFIPLLPPLLIAILPSRRSRSDVGKFLPYLMVAANVCVLGAITRAFYSL